MTSGYWYTWGVVLLGCAMLNFSMATRGEWNWSSNVCVGVGCFVLLGAALNFYRGWQESKRT